MNKLTMLTIICLLLAIMMPGMAQPAYAQPPVTPHQFYGRVTIGGNPAPAGTTIVAQIGGVTIASTTVDSQGKYGYSPFFVIPSDNPDTPAKDGGTNGDTIQFFVGGTAAQIYAFANGGMTKLNLSVGSGGGGTPPSAPTLSSPANSATGVAATPNLQWSASSGATSYQAQVSTASNFSTTVFNQSGITATQVAISPALNASTTYYWRVNASNSSGTSDWSTAWSFSTASGGTAPSAPTLSSPANSATGTSTIPNLQWSASSGATSYQAQVSTASDFSTTTFNQSGITATQVTVSPALNASTTYYWRVNASNSSGTSGWSSAWSFTTAAGGGTAPSAPTLSSPANSATGVATTPNLQWSASSGATSYQAQVSTASDFSTTVFNLSGISANQMTVSPALNASTTYYWRVNASNSSGTSDWSTAWSFSTASGSGGSEGSGNQGSGDESTSINASVLGGGGSFTLSSTGLLGTATTLGSPDGKVQLSLNANTTVTIQGQSLTVTATSTPPAPPSNVKLINAYDFGPNNTTFNPAITMTLKYDTASLPQGVTESNLYIAFWNGAAWTESPSTANTQNKIVSTQVSHFTIFALLGKTSQAPPPPSAPSFTVSKLNISPTSVKPGEQVTITATVTNIGGTKGDYKVVLQVNGINEAEKQVTLGAKETQQVSFTVSKEDADTYSVAIDDQSGSFEVSETAAPKGGFPLGSTGIIALALGGVLVIVLAIVLTRKRPSR